jgi:hypothetical protein
VNDRVVQFYCHRPSISHSSELRRVKLLRLPNRLTKDQPGRNFEVSVLPVVQIYRPRVSFDVHQELRGDWE